MNIEQRVLDPMECSACANMDIEEIDATLETFCDYYEGMIRKFGIEDYIWYTEEKEYFLKNAQFRNGNKDRFERMVAKLKSMGIFMIENIISDMQDTKEHLSHQIGLQRKIEDNN